MISSDTRVHQITAGFGPGDAISNEAKVIRKLLQEWGYQSEIYADPEHINSASRQACQPISSLSAEQTDALIFHFSIGTPLVDSIRALPGRKIMIYHNVTPGDYFRPYSDRIARQLDQGREQLAQLKNTFDLALADSEFNRLELESLGYSKTAVLPILLDTGRFSIRRQNIGSIISKRPKTMLFVGRLAPNKKPEDLIRVFGLYQKFYNPDSRLVWVGSWGGLEVYYLQIVKMIHELDVQNVILTGHVSEQKLATWFCEADAFVSTSEHEGFCVPILEAFHYGKPVIAYSAGAIPETVGDAGVLLKEKNFLQFAEAIDYVLGSNSLRAALIDRGRARLNGPFSLDRVSSLLKQHLESLLQSNPC
ncbi:MAG: glycosyltransferase family 4 protein [Acidobacteriota bacterium]